MFDFMKQKYKQMIKEAGFKDIIEFNDLHSAGKFVGNKLRRSDKEMINQKLINKKESPMVLAQKIEKLEKLEKDLKEEAFSKKKNILETIEYLITIYSNLQKINEDLEEEYDSGLYLPGYNFSGNEAYLLIGNGNIYLVDYATYEILVAIDKDKISHIEIKSEEEAAPAYVPKYKNAPSAPSATLTNQTWNNQSTDRYMQNYYKNEYERKLAQYQADLINVNAYNQNEQRKYEESLGKTRMVKHLYICFNDPKISNLECDYKWYSFITQKLPRLDIKDLEKGTTINGKKKEDEEIFKPEEKMKIGDDNVGYVEFQKELYINHTIKENQLEFNLSNGYHFIIIKYRDNTNFREMAKKLKSNSRVTEEGKLAFFKPKLDNDVNGFIGNMEDGTWQAIMDYKGAIYDIQAKYIKEQDKYIDYDEDIDGKLGFSTFYNIPNAMFSIIENN